MCCHFYTHINDDPPYTKILFYRSFTDYRALASNDFIQLWRILLLCGLLPSFLLRPLPLSSGFLPHIPMVIPDIVAWYRDWPHSMIFEFRSLNILVWPDTTSYRQQFLTHHSNCRWESGRGRGWILNLIPISKWEPEIITKTYPYIIPKGFMHRWY